MAASAPLSSCVPQSLKYRIGPASLIIPAADGNQRFIQLAGSLAFEKRPDAFILQLIGLVLRGWRPARSHLLRVPLGVKRQ